MLETLTKDQFNDALSDDELRQQEIQARPSFLRAALGVSLEIELFSMAARHRSRPVRTAHGLSQEITPDNALGENAERRRRVKGNEGL